jgi:hypothetical protein
MKTIILLFSLLALTSNVLAKTDIVLQNTTGAVIKFENKNTAISRITRDGIIYKSFTTFMRDALNVTRLNTSKGQTEMTASAQSINPGYYFLKFYYGKKSDLSDLSGPGTVFFEIKRDNNYNALGIVNVDEVLPCNYFPERGGPRRCASESNLNITFGRGDVSEKIGNVFNNIKNSSKKKKKDFLEFWEAWKEFKKGR